jgi:hypothetical protein
MKNLLFLAVFILTITGCKKEEDKKPKMPAPTQTGANVLAFKVNDEVHIYKGKKTYFDDNGVLARITSMIDETFRIEIVADDGKYNDALRMWVQVPETADVTPPDLNKSYSLSNSTAKSYYDVNANGGPDVNSYVADVTRCMVIFTRFDDKVMAGTFTYYGINEKNETISLTEGVFDIAR